MTLLRRHTGGAAVALALFGLTCLGLVRAQEGQELGTWAFSYPSSTLPGAMLNLRSLNEKTAGEKGFVRLSADKQSFVLGDGSPARFWACGSDVYHASPEDMARHARFLARIGVNLVRLHTQIAPDTEGPIEAVNEKEIDSIWRMVAALKKEGIYTLISPYWANGKKATQWGIDGYTGQTDLWGLLFFNPHLQAGYKSWVKALYTRPNPYTGVTLAHDPAVAVIQVQNEDGMFFWTMQGMKPAQQEVLGRLFAAWLTRHYGTLDAARTAWAGAADGGDDWASGKVGILPTWQLTQDQTGGVGTRVTDQVHFFADTQRGFYAQIADYYRNTLGCRQLVNASNWLTADPARLGDIERYTYTAADVVAVNRYYNGGVHLGPDAGWRIDPGDHFSNVSALRDPRSLPTSLKQVAGYPTIITESSWVAPLGYQSEGPFLAAAYQSLTGIDGFCWFSAGDLEYAANPQFPWSQVNGQYGLNKWSASVPEIMGQFPACALMYRKGYLKQGAPVVHEERPLPDLWARHTPLIAEDKSFDPNRAGTGAGQSTARGIDPLAFLVGPVEVAYGGDSSRTRTSDLTPYIDAAAKTVRSETGEIRLNYGKGLCIVNTPKAQGVTGFLSDSGPIALGDITISSGNPYATVAVVSMDGLPLRQSHRILVQVGTAARPTGWQAKAADFPSEDGKTTIHGFEVVKTGAAPWQIVSADVTLSIASPTLAKATLLDPAGYPSHPVPVTRTGGRVTVKLPADTMYLVLE